MTPFRLPVAALALSLSVCFSPLQGAIADEAAAPPPTATAKEIELGKKSAEEFEKAKSTKLLDPKSNPEAALLLEKLNAMAKALGQHSARPGITYTVKVVESDDVNAFTLPNGHIYFYRGLLDFAASDQEIAGVMAHEIGHNARMHALRGQAKAKKLSWVSLAAMAAMLAGGKSGADVGQFSQYLLLGVMNGYGVDYEKEADEAAVGEMIGAGYNPSALVTFMERLETKEKRSPEVRLGIFQTHPPSDERAEACLKNLKAAGVEYSPREVNGGADSAVVEKDDRYQVTMSDVVLLEFAKTGANAKARATQAAARTNALLLQGLQMHQISVGKDNGLTALGTAIAMPNAADAALQSKTIPATAQQWLAQYQRLFWKERLNGRF